MGTTPSVESVESVESEIARDLARRGLLVAPVLVLAAALLRGAGGATGAAIAIAIVIANLVFAAAAQGWAARRSVAVLGGVVLGGYVVRLAVVTVALLLLRHAAWLDFNVFAVILAVTHLGLLAWEARSVSMTLAYPGLEPAGPAHGGKD